MPLRRPLNILRNFVRLGASAIALHRLPVFLALLQVARIDVAVVDPDLDADGAERRARRRGGVVDVGAQRVQRHASLAVLLDPRHLGAAEAAAALDADAL